MNDPKVTVYSATWCAFCHAVKEYLNSKNVAFVDKDVENDPEAAIAAVTKSGQRGIPVVDIDGEIVVGFDRPKIDSALKAKSLVA